MQIASTQRNFQINKPQMGNVSNGTALQAANSAELSKVDGFVGSQDRFDGELFGKMLGGMIGAGVGAGAGTLAATVISASTGLSGWSMIGAGVAGLVTGTVAGGYIGSR